MCLLPFHIDSQQLECRYIYTNDIYFISYELHPILPFLDPTTQPAELPRRRRTDLSLPELLEHSGVYLNSGFCVIMAYVIVCLLIAHGGQRMRHDEPMLIQCWHSVHDTGPTLNQHWSNVSCLLRAQAVDGIYISAMMQMNALIRSEK